MFRDYLEEYVYRGFKLVENLCVCYFECIYCIEIGVNVIELFLCCWFCGYRGIIGWVIVFGLKWVGGGDDW